MLTAIDPIKVTEYSIVLAAAALPLTYFPILVVANDPDYMGDKTNGRLTNALGFAYLVAARRSCRSRRSRSMIVTKMGT